jgi:hypothetical protein
MEENPRIKFYELKSSPDTARKIVLKERLISQLLHELGTFYQKQAKSLSGEQEDRIIVKKLIAKAAKCYQSLANESEKTIQRCQTINPREV